MINVIYSANDKYFKMLYISALSMAMRTKESLCVYVMTLTCKTSKSDYFAIKQEQVDYLEETLKNYNKDSKAVLVNMQELYDQFLLHNKNHNTSYSPYTLLRLLTTYVPYLPSKLIYIDTDTMVYNDIKELYDFDLQGNEIGAVQDAMGHYFFGRTYCNAGVLLLDLDKIKESKLFDKCIKYVMTKRSIMPDQDAINYSTKKKILLPRKFNEQRGMQQDTVVKHFCKVLKFLPYMHTVNVKQLDFEKVHKVLKIHEFDDVFEEYEKLREGHENLLF